MTRSVTVLVVEDEAFIAMDAAAVLEEAGHEVCGTAADKAEALRLAELVVRRGCPVKVLAEPGLLREA